MDARRAIVFSPPLPTERGVHGASSLPVFLGGAAATAPPDWERQRMTGLSHRMPKNTRAEGEKDGK
jgi:hypothetical protein